MKNNLDDLKTKMDHTVLKNVSFDDKHYLQVLTSIKGSKIKKDAFQLRNKVNALLSVSVISIMFLSILYFAGTQLNLLNTLEQKQTSKPKENNMQEPINKSSNEKATYIPPKQEENYDDMTKGEILTKMLNTVDYFETAKGEFIIHNGLNQGYEVVEYGIRLTSAPAGYGKRTLDSGTVFFQEYYKDGTVWSIDERSKTYMISKLVEDQVNKGTALTLEEAFSIASDGNPQTIYRERPPISSGNALFPYEIASNYTRDLSKWEIEKQNEELLGHNTLVIKGKKNHRDFQTFRFWVDKDTGILVKYETYNSNGDVVDYLHPTKLAINVPFDSTKLVPNIEGYKDFKQQEQELPRMTTGNIDHLIPDELKAKWEEAKKKPNETTVLQFKDKWYIYVKKGYLVNYIEAKGSKGTLYLAKTSPQKSEFNFGALADGYNVDSLEIVYE
jgi:outer membrane lipoprotein-sorting protein